MSLFRHTVDLLNQAAGEIPRRVRGMISRRQVVNEESTGDRVTALGREALDGSYEQDEMDQLAPVGVLGRPAENATVESLVAFVGSDGSHPVSVSCLDGTRRAVIDAVGLDADETVLYTAQSVVKIGADGMVEIRSIRGTAVSLATKADVQAVWDYLAAQFNEATGHTHWVPGGTSAAITPAAGATIGAPAGTSKLKAE